MLGDIELIYFLGGILLGFLIGMICAALGLFDEDIR